MPCFGCVCENIIHFKKKDVAIRNGHNGSKPNYAAHANGNISIGVGTVGGMLIGTLALLFVVPTLFIVFQTIEERVMPKKEKGVEEAVAQIEE